MNDCISVTWQTPGGDISSRVPVGSSLMEAAKASNVPGVDGECGGGLTYATCHVRIVWAPTEPGEMSQTEADMLEFTDIPSTSASRLSCQLVASKALDGIVLATPDCAGT